MRSHRQNVGTPAVSQEVYSEDPADFFYMKVNVPCQSACPALTNVPAYIRALFEDDPDGSYEINRSANILPGVLGRICSRPCEDQCRHGEPELGEPVGICHLKRVAADRRSRKESAPAKLPYSGKRVAVVGAGPAGLAASHDLATVGFEVTLFDAFPEPGGMLTYGIPAFRLPRSMLREEIERILDLGIILKAGVTIGKDIPMERLLSEYDAVLATLGCYGSRRVGVPGEDLPGVISGLEFMMDVSRGRPPRLGKKSLVLGAGFTAFDCARSALRLGTDEASICIRRTEEDFKVTKDEVFQAKLEGVKILPLLVSQRILGDTAVEGVEFVRTRPGAPGPDGRRSFEPIEGSEFVIPADTVLVAVGQESLSLEAPGERDSKGLPVVDRETFRGTVPGLYFAGDYVTGPGTVIGAIAAGRAAAERIARDLTGNIFRRKSIRMREASITDRNRTWDYIHRNEMPTVNPPESRLVHYETEVETGLRPDQAAEESKRCYLCYLHYEIDMTRCIYCRYCIDSAPRDCIKLVDEVLLNEAGAVAGFKETTVWRDVNAVVIDNSRCIRCGECVRVCPVDCISVTRVELVERMGEEAAR